MGVLLSTPITQRPEKTKAIDTVSWILPYILPQRYIDYNKWVDYRIWGNKIMCVKTRETLGLVLLTFRNTGNRGDKAVRLYSIIRAWDWPWDCRNYIPIFSIWEDFCGCQLMMNTNKTVQQGCRISACRYREVSTIISNRGYFPGIVVLGGPSHPWAVRWGV
jgi:hypothetical protein